MPKINGVEFTIGADPEIWVKAKGGVVKSAYGLIPGTKKEPFRVQKGFVQVDGMALEFNIDPVSNLDQFNENIDTVMGCLNVLIGKHHEVEISPVAEFGAEYILGQPHEARVLGCDPDYNAYTGEPNPVPNADTPFRTASGHIHIGWTKDVNPLDPSHFEACCWLTKALDAYLGLPSMVWDRSEAAVKRRTLYGKPGAFRPKPYGMEYRVLSNSWLKPQVIVDKTTGKTSVYPNTYRNLVFGNTVKAITRSFEDNSIVDKKYLDKTAREIIETGDFKTASQIFDEGEILTPSYYRANYGKDKYEKEIKTFVNEGVGKYALNVEEYDGDVDFDEMEDGI